MRFHDSAAYVDRWRCGSSLGYGAELAWDAWLDDIIGGKTVQNTLTIVIKMTL